MNWAWSIVPKFTNREDHRAYLDWYRKGYIAYEEIMKNESSEVYNVSEDMDLEIAETISSCFLDIGQSSLIKAREDAKKFLAEIDLTRDITLPTLTTNSYTPGNYLY